MWVCGRDYANKIISIQLRISRDQSWRCPTPRAATHEVFDQKIFSRRSTNRGGLSHRRYATGRGASESGFPPIPTRAREGGHEALALYGRREKPCIISIAETHEQRGEG